MGVTRYIAGNLMTGKRIIDLPAFAGNWSDDLLTTETISCSIDLRSEDVDILDLDNTTTPGQSFLAAIEGDYVAAAGPIWVSDVNYDTQQMTLTAKGLKSVFDHRHILPVLAQTLAVDQFVIPDPADTSKTMPNPSLTTSYSGISLGTIAKRLVAQAMSWTGGSFPIVLPAEETDSDANNTRTWVGPEFKNLGEALEQLMQVRNGPEINFQPRLTSVNGEPAIEWLMEIGTKAQPIIFSNTRHLWDLGLKQPLITGLKIRKEASDIGSLAWQVGGKQADRVLVARTYDPTLINAGFPLYEQFDSSHNDVSLQGTLDAYANTDALLGRQPYEVWSFDAIMGSMDDNGVPRGPQLGDYKTGDFIDIRMPAFNREKNQGSSYKPAGGLFPHRIVGLSKGIKDTKVAVKCATAV